MQKRGQTTKNELLSSKKAQITVFVIFGMILLFVAAFVLYAMQLSSQTQLNRQAQEVISEFTELRDVQDYTQIALSNIANDGIEKLLLQGGMLTEDWPKSYEGKKYLPYAYTQLLYDGSVIISTSNVSYAVVEQVPCLLYTAPRPNLENEGTSYYPIKYEWLDNFYSRYNKLIPTGCMPLSLSDTVYSGFMGGYEFPALCSYNGSNANEDIKNAVFCGAYQYDYPEKPNSIQRQLEQFIQTNLSNYMNLSFFEKRGTNITFNFSETNVSVLYKKPTGMVVTLTFFADVNLSNRVFKQNVTFQTEIDGSFRQLHMYVQDLLMRSLKDPYFNITRDWNDSTIFLTYQPSFYMFISKEVCTYQNADLGEAQCTFGNAMDDDIYTFIDTAHRINGRPLTLNIAIQNRRPVLDFIHDADFPINFEGDWLDQQYFTNDTLLLEPVGVDADQDNITYNYTGWKQNYTEVIDWDCCQDTYGGPCNILNHTKCYDKIFIDFKDSLMNSSLFLLTNKSVNYSLNDSDLGYHNTTVKITDEHGGVDFQIVKILVFDLPKAILNFSNLFDDINNSFASVEDYFLLNSSASTVSKFSGNPSFSKINFTDTFEQFSKVLFPKDGDDWKLYTLPGEGYDLTNITLGNFTFLKLNDEVSQLHKISLVVYQNLDNGAGGTVEIFSPAAIKNVTVSQCLPHGYDGSGSTQLQLYSFDVDDVDTWAYPYGTNDQPPHVCCVPIGSTSVGNMEGGKFASSSAVCFEKEFTTVYPFKQFGEMAYFGKAIGENPKQVLTTPDEFNAINELADYPVANAKDDAFNDIYNITITQQCSGDRGNVCSGDVTIQSEVIEACADIDSKKSYQFARCGIPTEGLGQRYSYLDAGTTISSSATCEKLNGKTSFEKIFYDSLDDTDKNKFLQDIGLNSEEKTNLLLNGYCGTELRTSIIDGVSGPASIPLYSPSDNEPFSCLPKCSNGKCSYDNTFDECTCKYGDAICDNIQAKEFFVDNQEYYICKDDGACDKNCKYKDVTTKEACYCTVLSPDSGKISKTYTNSDIDPFFEGTNWLAYKLDKGYVNSNCCTEGVLIYSKTSGTPVCDDDVKKSGYGTIFFNNALLICNDGISWCSSQSLHGLRPTDFKKVNPLDTNPTKCEKICTNNGWVS